MFTPTQKQMMLKLFSMFVVVRGFNLALIVIAQYITAIFIMAPPSQSLSQVLFDRTLFALIFATVGAIASGYIINNFYDTVTYFDSNFVNKQFCQLWLNLYFK